MEYDGNCTNKMGSHGKIKDERDTAPWRIPRYCGGFSPGARPLNGGQANRVKIVREEMYGEIDFAG